MAIKNSMNQLEHIDAIEKRLWRAADEMRANSNHASNEYFLPVMGLVFLRHAFSRYLAAREEIETNMPTRAGKKRRPRKADFSAIGAIFLQDIARFDHLVALPDNVDRAKAIIAAMESIEHDYESLRGVLPKNEYTQLDNDVLGKLLRHLNPDELKLVSGDVFGRIYEYFLTQFADQKAHDNGEFFTPVSLVALIAHVLDPQRGTVLDPACGSGGMFVQSARTIAERGKKPSEQLTFRGLEKNATTIRLAKMNLAVHGLEGNIRQAITYYDDPHQLAGNADFVMANPPFNVDEIDAGKVRDDPRIPFGLPGANKRGKVSNGNYVWINYFYSYLNARGRAGFVMSSQASSAGGAEAAVRQKLIESGDVEAMIAIRANFFYTRSVPCELWFFNRAKPAAKRDHVLMIDARNIYREVTRKIYDFSPEQQRNLLAIVHLYRDETARFLETLRDYCAQTLTEAAKCFADEKTRAPLQDFFAALDNINETGKSKKLTTAIQTFQTTISAFRAEINKHQTAKQKPSTNAAIKKVFTNLEKLSNIAGDLTEQTKLLHKHATEISAARDKNPAQKTLDAARIRAVAQLNQTRYFHNQARWLIERFPDAKLRDIPGLVKLVNRKELAGNDWSLTPGRYVGVAPDQPNKDFNFAQTMRNLHAELRELNDEAATLAKQIEKNYDKLVK